MITSVKNSRIKDIRALQTSPKARREAQVFVVEGVRLAEEAAAAGWKTRLCLFTEGLIPRGQKLVDDLGKDGVECILVAEHVMKSASDTQTPQGVLLVVEQKVLPIPPQPDFVLVLDQVRDPGNTGTLLRTAKSAGVQAVLFTPGSTDAFAPKVVRSAMGAHFSLPIQTLPENELAAFAEEHHMAVWAAAADADQAYNQVDLAAPLALVIGSEAHGVSHQLLQSAAGLRIPMPGGGESLNAAIAGAVLMFEVVRQRLTN